MTPLDEVRPLPAVIAALFGAIGITIVWATAVPAAFSPMLARALGVTFLVTGASLVLTLGLIVVLVLALADGSRWVQGSARLIVSSGRAVPLVCTLLLVYWVPPLLGLDLDPLWCAVLAIGFVEACYLAFILDGLRTTVDRRYREVGYLLGLRPVTWWGRVMLPQMTRLSVPHLLNALLYTLMSSSLVSFIAVEDLTYMAGVIATATADPVAGYTVVFCTYLTLAAGLTLVGVLVRAALTRRVPFAVVGRSDA